MCVAYFTAYFQNIKKVDYTKTCLKLHYEFFFLNAVQRFTISSKQNKGFTKIGITKSCKTLTAFKIPLNTKYLESKLQTASKIYHSFFLVLNQLCTLANFVNIL